MADRRSRARAAVGRLAFYAAVVLLAIPATFCHVMTRPPGGPIERAPEAFREVSLEVGDRTLAAWHRPGHPERTGFVVVHGLGDVLSSFVPFAERLADRGHPVLLPRLRGHGADRSPTGLGALEHQEVAAALDRLRAEGADRVGLFGFSLGAVAALRAAAGRDDVAAVVVEAPYDTLRSTVARHARLLYGLPDWVPLIPISIAFAEWRAGYRADDADALAAAAAIRAPLLAIADGADERMPEQVVRRVYDAHPGPKQLWVAPAGHIGAVLLPDYWPRVLGFLEACGASPAPEPATPPGTGEAVR